MTVTKFLHTQVPFLDGLTPEQAHELAAQSQQRSYAAGQIVLFRGTTVDGLHVVASGKVSVWVRPEKGSKNPVQVAELGPGEVFGETSIVEMGTAGATIKAVEDETLVFIIPQEAFQGILDGNEEFRARAQSLIDSRKKTNSSLLPA
ncbi:MAG: cyclic nucleotide-binding domain-containing protein [Elusimicrobia bacterium]|nr:cyclic nucleotide-binding domain-containing protein [Elusimicrobiota bacterium]